MRQELLRGGSLLRAVVVCHPDSGGPEHLIWIRTSWLAGFRLLYTFKARGVRGYRDLNRLVALLRGDWGYRGPTVQLHDDPGLTLAEAVSPSLVRADGGRRRPLRKPASIRAKIDGS